ncbi:PPE family protein [Mycobacterium intracellulare]|uniref:PPE family protein n=1 Tax=Mycobacterium intracellulare TaxID=1767 RepID=UPI001E5030DF|nr:PPE family protein [Mycobacterium intracellulare]
MTAPIWMASPPEVHSTLLSSGPGPGPLLASAATWSSLSVEYAESADELTALLGAVQAGSWEGPTAGEYVAAHAPYLAWLVQASADSATIAAQQDIAATAYTVALAAMPTMPELAANHATHAVLTATNFFGINTIPIAVNEADYARMWVQAATVMSTYEGVATAAVATAPPAEPAPEVMNATALAATAEQSSSYPPDTQDQWMDWLEQTGFVDFYNRYIQPLIDQLMNNPFFQSLFSGFDPWLPSLGNPLSFLNPFNIAFALGYPMDFGSYFGYLAQMFSFVAADLAAAFASGNPATIAWTILFTTIEVIGTVITDTIALIKTLLEQMIVLIPLIVPLLTVAVVPLVVPTLVGGLAGLTGLAGLHAIPVPFIPAPALVPVALAPTRPHATPAPAPHRPRPRTARPRRPRPAPRPPHRRDRRPPRCKAWATWSVAWPRMRAGPRAPAPALAGRPPRTPTRPKRWLCRRKRRRRSAANGSRSPNRAEGTNTWISSPSRRRRPRTCPRRRWGSPEPSPRRPPPHRRD